MKYLIVDDHEGVRRMIHFLLAGPGDSAKECESADEAMRVAPEFQPDVVTMDLRMPGLSAIEAIRSMRVSYPDTCVVVVSTYDSVGLRQEAFDAGASGYVVKDNLVELPLLIARILAQKKHRPGHGSGER